MHFVLRMIIKTAFEANEHLYGKLVGRKLAQGTFLHESSVVHWISDLFHLTCAWGWRQQGQALLVGITHLWTFQ